MEVEKTISGLLGGNVKEGSAQLEQLFNTPEIWAALCKLMTTHSDAPLRLYCATILRKYFIKYNKRKLVSVEQQNIIKEHSVSSMYAEGETTVRNAIAYLVGVFLVNDMKHADGQWTKAKLVQLFEFIFSHEPLPSERAALVFRALTDTAIEVFLSHMVLVCNFFETVLSKAIESSNVNTPTMQSVLKSMSFFVPHNVGNVPVEQCYQRLLPNILAILKLLVTPSVTYEEFSKAFDVVEAILDYIPKIIKGRLPELVHLMLEVCNNVNVNMGIRTRCACLLGMVAQYHTKYITKLNLIAPMLKSLYRMMIESPIDEVDDYFHDDMSDSPIVVAAETIDMMARQIPSKHIFPHLLQILEPAIQSNDFVELRCAFLIMASVAEGCTYEMRGKYLDPMLEVVIAGTRNSHQFVRNAAFFALSEFTEHLRPSIAKKAGIILPILLEYFAEIGRDPEAHITDDSYIERFFYAIESTIESLEEPADIKPFIEPTMKTFMVGLNPANPVKFRQLTLGTVSSLVTAAKQDFLPYLNVVIDIIRPYLTNSAAEDVKDLRIAALNTLTKLIYHIGRENFLPLLHDTANFTINLLKCTEDSEEKCTIYLVFAAIAQTYKEDISSALPEVMPFIYLTLAESEVIVPDATDKMDDNEDPNQEISIEESDDEDDDGDDNEDILSDEKSSALQTVKALAEHCPQAFSSYAEASYEYAYCLMKCNIESVARDAIEAVSHILIAHRKHIAPDQFSELLDALLSRLESCLSEETDIETATTIVEAFNTLLTGVGKGIFRDEKQILAMLKIARDGLNHKFKCQEHNSINGDDCLSDTDEDNEAADSDLAECLLEECGNIICNVGNAIEPHQYNDYFKNLLPMLLKKMPKNRRLKEGDDDEESFNTFLVLAILSESFVPLGNFTANYIDQLLPHFLDNISSSGARVRQNALFGLGMLVSNSGPASFKYYPMIIGHLSTWIGSETGKAAMDNLIGCVCHCIMTNSDLVPLPEVLPIVFQKLPLREDFIENKTVFRTLHMLYENKRDVLLVHFQQIVLLSIHVLMNKQYENDEDIKALVIGMLKQLNSNHPNEFNSLFASAISAEQKAFLDAL